MEDRLAEFKQTQFYIIWGALLSSIFIYAGVMFIIDSQPSGDPSMLGSIKTVFIAISCITATGALMLSRRMFRDDVLQAAAAESRDKGAVLQKYFVQMLISWVLVETIAVFGLAIGFLSGDPEEGLPFIATSAILFIALLPQPGKISEKLQRLKPM